MKKILNVALIVSLLFFASCEGNTEYLLNVKNASSETVRLIPDLPLNYLSMPDTIDIGVGASVQIAQWNQRGGNARSVDITGSIIKINGVQSTSNKVLDSAVAKYNFRWTEIVKEKSKRPADYWHYYELTLRDGDFQ